MILVEYLLIIFLAIYLVPCKSLKCYECTGHVSCGQGQTYLAVECSGKCMIYRNNYDGGTIVRRCCTNDCGGKDGLRPYEGRYPAYFCSEDMCNGARSDGKLFGEIIDPLLTSTTSVLSTTNDDCYDCTSYNSKCGIDESTIVYGCKSCVIYLNTFDDNRVNRRCCTSNCGSSGTIDDYEGRRAYFCSSSRCNGIGAESMLLGGTVSSSTSTTTITVQSSFQCYDCSGPDCGKEGSALLMNCPTCMLYQNPNDQTTIERRCCWWTCGLSNSISSHNGIQTYFCSNNKCNGYGAENVLVRPVTTQTSTTQLTTSTRSSFICRLYCQNGGTPEIEDGCFCYCLENTYGRECEYINCSQPDIDTSICSSENRSLCEESEIFASACLHLCGKC
ncbi:unnamed protein product [Rotaria magnacalcarata]|uniref:EGF-like domain-containing protein n=1 Tax=Rotaria magnacalcarata TaxID=392030 RepID=A0A8S2LBS7_9BILA|nr:unnamed protein product [Rotaria magnacalcarata]CAF3847146.1 unnamed protein product [Rotaria magnacalcarata]CAF3883360.1 unnamed protein product [Rotaria magnacalcarata]